MEKSSFSITLDVCLTIAIVTILVTSVVVKIL